MGVEEKRLNIEEGGEKEEEEVFRKGVDKEEAKGRIEERGGGGGDGEGGVG